MIKPEDAEFHPSEASMTTWAETIGFWFAVPEEAIYANVYVLCRPNVGAAYSSINVIQGRNHHPFSVDFTDPHMHVPCPDSMLDFTLQNGLRVTVTKPPNNYRFSYVSPAEDACSFDLTFEGVMPAWDPNDPRENPLLADPDRTDLGLGDAWSGGHLDFVGRVRGTLRLRGVEYEVDSMGGMDRSWGRRTELGQAAISYLHMPFDDDFGFHVVTGIELDRGQVRYSPFRFGYVYENGGTTGLTEARMTGGQAQGLLPMWNAIEVTDVLGRSWTLRGTAVANAPWYTFSPSYVTFQALVRYDLDGRTAFGLMADTYGIEFLADRTSRHGRLTSTAFGPGI
ncbi:hypothetical protein GIS00_00790 [Nakamurella sp. YIM 132087]|uniref:DUF7064 domain-containing protein n=1 Tax=Nakamurella alba TaxID=2665158 RepID=A0A7K1FG67_9ACTN|nr:hypothetical protein [Nakamurella alba]MTD12479.1 hypothetical protein [Nakamurella alba]